MCSMFINMCVYNILYVYEACFNILYVMFKALNVKCYTVWLIKTESLCRLVVQLVSHAFNLTAVNHLFDSQCLSQFYDGVQSDKSLVTALLLLKVDYFECVISST